MSDGTLKLLFECDGYDPPMRNSADLFDEFSNSYESALATALAISGEGREYFANERVKWLHGCLVDLNEHPKCALDFGCGDGNTSPILQNILNLDRVRGVDVSPKSVESAQANHGEGCFAYCTLSSFKASGELELAYCNGVFHHIPPPERLANLEIIRRALRPNGLFSFWENNPWNPATHYVMSRCAFDKDAIMISPSEAKRLLSAAGFQIVRTDFLFVFPRSLKFLRGIEPWISNLPVGTQYQILCRTNV
jgi:SAM-dependent methyltransferase